MSPATKKGFTLLEMLIAVTIFSLILLYLYQSLTTLQGANVFYGERLKTVTQEQTALKSIYLDLSLSNSIEIINDEKEADIVLMQTSNSVHRRIMPYVGYIVKEGALYRIESSKKLSIPLNADQEMSVDSLGAVKHFRLYRSKTKIHYLLDLRRGEGKETLLKVRALNAQ